MSLEEKETENLFSYGTLQTEAVQLATFGRRLEGKPDFLVGYSLTMIQIQDQNYYWGVPEEERGQRIKITTAIDQRKGISLAKAWEIVHYYNDPDKGG